MTMMRPELGDFGVWRWAREVSADQARAIERLGYGTIWLGASPGDLVDAERVLDATETITVATGIVNVWLDDAEDVAAAYHRLEAKHPGRFLLGIGIGHPESPRYAYTKPYDSLVDYLDRLDTAGVPEHRRLLAALGPRVLALSAARTLGAHPYFTTPEHTAHARDVLGDALLAPEHMVVLEPDPDAARAIARPVLERYLGLRNYTRNLQRHGFTPDQFAGGGDDALVDAIALHGTVEHIANGLRAHLRAGADHVSVQVLPSDADPLPALTALAAELA